MTTISLDHVWINLSADPSVYQEFPNMAELSVTSSTAGEVRQYAGGRRRIVRRAGRARSVSLTIPYCDRARIEWLEENAGELVCVRDDRGRKIWGVFFEVAVQEHEFDPDYGAVSLEIAESSHVEEV